MAYIQETKKDKNYVFMLERNIKAYMFWTILILGIVSISLAVAIAMLTPLKEKKPYLLFFADGQTNFVKVAEANLDVRADEALLKSILAGYVKNREMINRINDIERYQIVRIQSKRAVWSAFENLVKQKNSIYTIPNFYRDIKIINVALLSTKVATIDFFATTYQDDITQGTTTRKKYRASVEYGFEESMELYNDAIENPTGFKVIKYTISEIIDKENEAITKESEK